MHSTNYNTAFIGVAPDTRAVAGTVPPRPDSIAGLQHRLLSKQPGLLTSDDLLFAVHAIRKGIAPDEQPAAREAFLAKPQACMRASPLVRQYGWGIYHDAAGRVRMVAMESPEYAIMSRNPSLRVVHGMRLRRA